MYHKRHYIGMIASLVLGALCMSVLVIYDAPSAPAFVLLAAILGGVIGTCSRTDDMLFRDEAIELLQSLKTAILHHTKEHAVGTYNENSVGQQIARLREEVSSIQQRDVEKYTKHVVGKNESTSQ